MMKTVTKDGNCQTFPLIFQWS